MEQQVDLMVAHNYRTGARYLIIRTMEKSEYYYDVFILNDEGEAELISEDAQAALLKELDELVGTILSDERNSTLH